LPSEQLDPGRTYVAARAAALSGDHRRSAQLLAQLAESGQPSPTITRQAALEAISAGNMQLALRLIEKLPRGSLPVEARLLLAANEIRANRPARAVDLLAAASDSAELAFLSPFITAWTAAERRDARRAVEAMASVQPGSVLAAAKDEHLALILLKLRRADEADPYARRAVGNAGGREQRIRLALADGFLAAGDRTRALAMAAGLGLDGARARQLIESGRPSGLGIDTTAEAFSELLLRLAIDLNQLNRGLPIGFAQIARFVAPENDGAALLLAVFLESRERVDDALGVLRSVRPQSGLAAQARDLETRALLEANRGAEALAIARTQAASPGADASDYARLGDTLSELKRYDDSAAAYGRALALSANGRPGERWTLYLLQANAYESGDRWPEAKAALEAALALAPDQPLILNFLGYAKLERGEDLDLAEAMIRKASQLAPDDASITDSLGWALYKRGRLDQAIEVLQRAARSDPKQAEIHEHLGDALYRAGRKFEARFAWQAALTSAEDDVAPRIRAKLESGLTPETAAP
jgi:tetratricopeptide (TPR) repeat protein